MLPLFITVKASLANKLTAELEGSSDDEQEVDPKVRRELEEISKIHDSAMVNCIREDLVEQVIISEYC